MARDLWMVFGVRGSQIVRPAVYEVEHMAKCHFDKLEMQMSRIDIDGDQDPGWSVHKVRAKEYNIKA